MRYVKLAGSSVPAIGQGTWYMGEDPGRKAAEVAALQQGIELGLNLIDTRVGLFPAERLLDVLRQEPVDFVQFNYSIGERNAERELLPYCADKGIAVLINRPFQRAALFEVMLSLPRALGDPHAHALGKIRVQCSRRGGHLEPRAIGINAKFAELRELLAHLARQRARDQVGGTAGREGHDQGDGLVGPGEGAEAGGCGHEQGDEGFFHEVLSPVGVGNGAPGGAAEGLIRG